MIRAALFAMILTASPAVAQTSVSVPIFGLALDRAEIAASLDTRLERAARNVCRVDGVTSLQEQAFARQCRKEALANARAQLQTAQRATNPAS